MSALAMSAASVSVRLSSRTAQTTSFRTAKASPAAAVGRGRSAGLAVRAGLVTKVTSEELEVAIAERSTPLVIDFYATWCGPCVLIATELEKVAEAMGDKVKFLKVDTEEEDDLAGQLQIYALPTVVFVPAAANKQAVRTEGLLTADMITKILKEQML